MDREEEDSEFFSTWSIQRQRYFTKLAVIIISIVAISLAIIATSALLQ